MSRIATARGYAEGRIIEVGEAVPDSVPPGSWTGDNLGEFGKPEPGPLDLNVIKLGEYLEGVTVLADLDALLAAEKAGKTRKSAIDAISARIAAINHASLVAELETVADAAVLAERLAAEKAGENREAVVQAIQARIDALGS